MRLRNKPWAQDHLDAHPQYVINGDQATEIDWRTAFAKEQPLYLEVGSGKGQFAIGLAQAHPDRNIIAMEMMASVAIDILDKQIDAELPNLLILHADGAHLDQYFEPHQLARIYLNFSDPWPKKRHTKRRLTSPLFLAQYQALLAEGGELHFKTDNRGLFEYSLGSFSQAGWTLKQVWLDLHDSDYEGNILTEYEEKFSGKGHPIYRLEAIPPQPAHAPGDAL